MTCFAGLGRYYQEREQNLWISGRARVGFQEVVIGSVVFKARADLATLYISFADEVVTDGCVLSTFTKAVVF